MAGRTRRGPLRALLGAILVLALLACAGLAAAALVVQRRLDPVALTARIERDVLRQTGRTLTLTNLRVRLLPLPTVEADDVALGNWTRGPRPQMATASRLQAHLALLPLLRHVVRLEGVTLTQPDIVLERAADGNANWQLHAPARPAGVDGTTVGGGARWRVEVGSVRLLDGRLAWSDARAGWTGAVDGLRLEASGLAGDAPSASLSGRHGAAAFEAEVSTGALSRLDPASPSRAPWRLRIEAGERQDGRAIGRIGITGTIDDPARLRGYALDVEARAERLDALDALFPHAALPAVADLVLHARVVDAAPVAAAGRPRLASLDLRTGAFDAGSLPHARRASGLAVESLSLHAAEPAAPLAVTLAGHWTGQPVTLHGTLGTLAGWQDLPSAASGSMPVALELAAGAAHVAVDGGAGTVSDLRVKVTAPALRTLLAVGPALTGVTASARVQVQWPAAVTVSQLALASHELGASGTATLLGRAHPTLTASLVVAHADLDALAAGWRTPAAPAAPAPATPASTTPASTTPASTTVAPTVVAVNGGAPVPFAALRLADLAIRVDGQHLRFGGADYHDLAAELAVHDGTLTLAPFGVTGPAGAIAGSLAASAADHSLTLTVRPSMVQAGMLATLLGRPGAAQGSVELVGDLTATGGGTAALLASLTGRAGLSMVDGRVADAALEQVLGRLPQLKGPGLDAGGQAAVRCLALPARITGGVATIAPIELQTARLEVQGHGTVRLRDGGLDLHLLPRIAIGGTGASIPVHVAGTLGGPQAGLDPAAPGGRFALTIGPAASATDSCGPALAAARFGAPGPSPGPEAAGRPRKGPKGLDILRGLGLFR